jgi:hypothetical protein
MSHHQFSSLSSYSVAELNLDEAHANGVGGFNCSSLVIPVSLDLRYPYKQAGYAIQLRELRCRLVLKDSSYLTPSISVPLQVRMTADHPHWNGFSVYLVPSRRQEPSPWHSPGEAVCRCSGCNTANDRGNWTATRKSRQINGKQRKSRLRKLAGVTTCDEFTASWL